MFTMHEKVVVIIGRTGIIGAFVKGISEAGGKVVLLGRNQAEGEERVRQVRSTGGEAIFLPADV